MNDKIPPQVEIESAASTEGISRPVWINFDVKPAPMSMEIEAPLHYDDIWEELWDDKISGIMGG